MTLLSRAKAMPLPEPRIVSRAPEGPWPDAGYFTADQLRAAREQIAAEGDEVIGRLLLALDDAVGLIEHLGGNAKMQRAALAEARKA